MPDERKQVEIPSWAPPLPEGSKAIARIEILVVEAGPGQNFFLIGEEGCAGPGEMIGMLEAAKLQTWTKATGAQMRHTHN